MTPITTMLRTVPGFSHLDDGSLKHLAAGAHLVEAGPGSVLFREWTIPESLYVLLDGRISLTGSSGDASSAVIDILEPTSSFVLANVLADEPYLVGAQAIKDSLLVRLGAEPLREIVGAQPAAAMAMIRAMSTELGNVTRQIVDLKVRIAAQRLGTYLLSLVKEPVATRAEFRLPITKGLLAPWLGCRAENLSRAFTSLRRYGVETHGSRVVLHDIARLRDYAGASEPNQAELRPVEEVFSDAFRLRAKRSRGI
jgi:CRP/FNR family transcriptional activator FtrB